MKYLRCMGSKGMQYPFSKSEQAGPGWLCLRLLSQDCTLDIGDDPAVPSMFPLMTLGLLDKQARKKKKKTKEINPKHILKNNPDCETH